MLHIPDKRELADWLPVGESGIGSYVRRGLLGGSHWKSTLCHVGWRGSGIGEPYTRLDQQFAGLGTAVRVKCLGAGNFDGQGIYQFAAFEKIVYNIPHQPRAIDLATYEVFPPPIVGRIPCRASVDRRKLLRRYRLIFHQASIQKARRSTRT